MTTWVATVDEIGRTYYFDPHSRQTRWEPPPDDDEALCNMLRETQAEVGDHVRIHLASKVKTCLRIGLDHALRGALREWRRAAVHTPPMHRFVPPMARALSAWMIQRDRTVAAIAGTMLLQDYVELLKLRIEALESAERAQAEFERLSSSARSSKLRYATQTHPQRSR